MDFDELVANGKVKRIFRAKHKITIPDIVSHTRLTQPLEVIINTGDFCQRICIIFPRVPCNGMAGR